MLDYPESQALGLAGASADPVGVEALARFAAMNPNNVGWHEPGQVEGPWAATRELELESISMLADLMGGRAPEVGGFLTGGGAESNLMALWLARNAMRPRGGGRLTVLAGRSVHSSVVKGCDIIGLNLGRWERCARDVCAASAAFGAGDAGRLRAATAHRHRPHPGGHGLVMTDLDAEHRLDPVDLARRISEASARGSRRFVIVATVGTTTTGAIDSVEDIGAVIAEAGRADPAARFHVHVDAAMGGMVVPFLDAGTGARFGFDLEGPDQRPIVDSLSIDMHKAGLAPIAAGVFLVRSRHKPSVFVPRFYQPGRGDMTISGSRAGAVAAATWAVLRHRGRSGSSGDDGYTGTARRLARLARETAARLETIGATVPSTPATNIIAAIFPTATFDTAAVRAVAARHSMPAMYLSRTNDECPREAFRLCFMPHVREATVDAALAGFAAAAAAGAPSGGA